MKKMKILNTAYEAIVSSIGQKPHETGGVLFGNTLKGIIQKFVFDKGAYTSSSSYDPNIDFINQEILKAKSEGMDFLGFAHSHPRGFNHLSGDYGDNTGDLGYIKAIFDALPKLKYFFAPIIYSNNDGKKFTFLPYCIERENIEGYKKIPLKIIKQTKGLTGVSKIQGSVNIELMRQSKIVVVGIGGANGICESFIRSGIHHMTLIDYDKVDESNIITQGYFLDEVGQLKTEALKARLLRINPKLQIEIHSNDIFDIKKKRLKTICKNADLLLCMTDSFDAQAYSNKLSLKYQIPSIQAQMYQNGLGGEVSFYVPGLTQYCHRCWLKTRYEAYANGYKNDVNSNNTTNFSITYINSIIGLLGLAIINRNVKNLFGDWFEKNCTSNFLQFRLSPYLDHPHFDSLTDSKAFDSIWYSFNTDKCVDCQNISLKVNSNYKSVKSTKKTRLHEQPS